MFNHPKYDHDAERDRRHRREFGTQEPRHDRPAPLASERVSIDRKEFFIDLHENHRGKFVKLTERVGDKRNTVLIPQEALAEIAQHLTNFAKA